SKPARIIPDQIGELRTVTGDCAPLCGEMTGDVQACAFQGCIGQPTRRRQCPGPDGIAEQPSANLSCDDLPEAIGGLMVRVRVVRAGRTDHAYAACSCVCGDACCRVLQLLASQRRMSIAQAEEIDAIFWQTKCGDGVARLLHA